MDYQSLRDLFKGILNRNDCTDTLADQFIGLSLLRTERKLATRLMTKYVEYTATDPWVPIDVPDDILAIRTIRVDDVTLRRESETAFDPEYNPQGTPENFIFRDGKILIAPEPKVDSVVSVTYYAKFVRQTDDLDTPYFADDLPDLIAYGALIYAADWFVDVRKGDFKETYRELGAEVQLQSDMEEMSGGNLVIRNPYEGIA